MLCIRRRDIIIYSTPVLVIALLGAIIFGRLSTIKENAREYSEIKEIVSKAALEENGGTQVFDNAAVAQQVADAQATLETINEKREIARNLSSNSSYTVTADHLCDWAKRAYDEEWEYVAGGCEEGSVDCSGLIKSCVGVCARGSEELFTESANTGDISSIPEIPGLGVYYQGHVGIYVGDGKVIDARTENAGIGYDSIDYEGWTNWFEIQGVDYSRYTTFAD